jgi:enamine deaminase RidA (YjgF/YER057c/UK114 family)/protein tyrosine phosphatase (PTP) superfamily phosphohydrolase (DUF442 family)
MTTRSRRAALVLATVLAALTSTVLYALDDTPPAETAAAVDIPNAKTPLKGVLTGGQPTAEALAAAAAAGYKTVVNLRSEAEMEAMEDWDEAAAVTGLGMDYVYLPMAGAAGLTVDNARRLAEVLADPAHRPAMIHCASGNRVGGLLALKAYYVDGEDADAALELGLAAGLTKLEETVRQQLASADASASTVFVPDGWERAYEFGYAPVLRIGDMVILSGVPAGGEGSYEDKIRRMYERVQELLETAGATFADVVELTTYHLEPRDSPAFRAEFERYMPIHREFFGDHRPAWTAVGTTVLLSPTAVVEMRVVAFAGSGEGSRVVRSRPDAPAVGGFAASPCGARDQRRSCASGSTSGAF